MVDRKFVDNNLYTPSSNIGTYLCYKDKLLSVLQLHETALFENNAVGKAYDEQRSLCWKQGSLSEAVSGGLPKDGTGAGRVKCWKLELLRVDEEGYFCIATKFPYHPVRAVQSVIGVEGHFGEQKWYSTMLIQIRRGDKVAVVVER